MNKYPNEKSKLFQNLVKAGAIISTSGTASLIFFVIVLLAFPVLKECNNDGNQCKFISSAPEPIRNAIHPIFLASSLGIIAIGVIMIRFGTRYDELQKRPD
jgi:hypothetical protein